MDILFLTDSTEILNNAFSIVQVATIDTTTQAFPESQQVEFYKALLEEQATTYQMFIYY